MTVKCVFCGHVLHEGEKYKVMRRKCVCMLCVIELANIQSSRTFGVN